MQLVNLRRKDAFYQHDGPQWVRNVWPRPESFNWFCKANRDRLVEQGAMHKLGRDWFVDTEVFPTAAERILGVCQGEGAPR